MLHTLDMGGKALWKEGVLFLGQWFVVAGTLFLLLQRMGGEVALQTLVAGDVQNVLHALGTFTISESPIHFWVGNKLIEISALCSGLLEIILLASVMLVTPNETWKKKTLGILAGAFLLYVFNVLRIVITIQQLLHTSFTFAEFTHDVLFRLVLLLGFALLYWGWLNTPSIRAWGARNNLF